MRIIVEILNDDGTDSDRRTEIEGDPSHFMKDDILDTRCDGKSVSLIILYRRLVADYQQSLGYIYLICKDRHWGNID